MQLFIITAPPFDIEHFHEKENHSAKRYSWFFQKTQKKTKNP